MIDAIRTFAYGVLIITVDALARPIFWLIHRR